jgi:type II secretory pathway pseudopilin PulG
MRPFLSRAGFTVVEAVIAMTLVGLVLTKLTMVMDQARRAHQDESVAMALEDQAMVLMDRIAFALVGSSADNLDPLPIAPFPSATIHYQISLGVEDGVPVWSDPEVIGLSEDSGQVFWGQNVGEMNERIVVWANTVSQMLEDELLNGIDDNENDLADELGLAFVLDERAVTIRLSLERVRDDGQKIQVTRETTVTCRN